MKSARFVALALALIFSIDAVSAEGVDKLYVIDCGWAHAVDQSRWSPGINVGVPIDVSDNCYLIHHTQGGYLLWDTGITDAIAERPNGFGGGLGAPVWHRSATLLAKLEELNLKPADIRYVAISHTHPDHAGNVDEFPTSMLSRPEGRI
jgi:N-acyl homoserine lactone hydrolase